MNRGKTTGEIVTQVLQEYLPGDSIRTWWLEDPEEVAQSMMPALVVEKQETERGPMSTGHRRHAERMVIRLIVNRKKLKGIDKAGRVWLEEIVEARDPDDRRKYHANSLLGILTTRFSLTETNSDTPAVYDQQAVRVEYLDSVRRRRGKAEIFDHIAEAEITIDFLSLVTVENVQ